MMKTVGSPLYCVMSSGPCQLELAYMHQYLRRCSLVIDWELSHVYDSENSHIDEAQNHS